jgi:hypothetical protein
MNPAWDGGKRHKKRENSAKNGNVGTCANLMCNLSMNDLYFPNTIKRS